MAEYSPEVDIRLDIVTIHDEAYRAERKQFVVCCNGNFSLRACLPPIISLTAAMRSQIVYLQNIVKNVIKHMSSLSVMFISVQVRRNRETELTSCGSGSTVMLSSSSTLSSSSSLLL
jgi:hypothetical protein